MREWWRNWRRENASMIIAMATAALLIGVALSQCGCANWQVVAVKTLANVERANQAAEAALIAIDVEKQNAIVAASKSFAEGHQQLEAWRKTYATAAAAIDGSRAAVKLAGDGLRDISMGAKDPTSAGKWIVAALNGARNMLALLKVVGINLPVEF